MEELATRWVGIDVGKTAMMVRIIIDGSEGLRIMKWHGKTDAKGREQLRQHLRPGDVVAIEAGEPGFTIAREIMEQVGSKVLVLNPGRLAVIFKSMKKTDAEDALKLARLVMRIPEEELPVVSIPSEEERRKRALVSEDDFFNVTRTRFILRLHSVYLRAGITALTKKDLGMAGKRHEALALLTGKPDYFRKEAVRLERLLGPVEQSLAEMNEEVKQELQTDALAPILMSVSGVGPVLAFTFRAHIGDGSRFDTVAQVSNYVGFVPRLDMSGQSMRTGHITKRGCKHIRRIAVQSAWALVRSKEGGALKIKYREISARRGKKIAIVAVAKKLIELLWVLSQKKELYRYATPETIRKKFRFYGLQFQGSVA